MDPSIFITPLALIAIFYFLIVRPQQKRTQQQADLMSSLAPGDRVITYSGMYATIVETGDPLKVSIADGIIVEVAPPAIAGKVTAEKAGVAAGESVESAIADGDEEADGQDA